MKGSETYSLLIITLQSLMFLLKRCLQKPYRYSSFVYSILRLCLPYKSPIRSFKWFILHVHEWNYMKNQILLYCGIKITKVDRRSERCTTWAVINLIVKPEKKIQPELFQVSLYNCLEVVNLSLRWSTVCTPSYVL